MSEPTKSRRAAREAAFQAVYQCLCGGSSISAALDEALTRRQFSPNTAAFIRELANGAVSNIGEIDSRYAPFLKPGWTPERLSVIDRLLLRLAVFELWSIPGIPPRVTVSEVIKLARRYGSAESDFFIQGVLGKVVEASPKAEWDPSQMVESEPEEDEDETQEEEPKEETPAWTIRAED